MHIRRLIIAVIISCSMGLIPDPALGEKPASYIYPQTQVSRWLYHRSTRQIFASTEDQLLKFSPDGRIVARSKVTRPTFLIDKPRHVVVVSDSGSHLRIFDTNLDVARSIAMKGRVLAIFTSRGDNGFVYVVRKTLRDTSLLQVDISEGQIRNTLDFPMRGLSSNARMNGTGTSFGFFNRNPSSVPSRFFRINESRFEVTPTNAIPRITLGSRYDRQIEMNAADPLGQNWIIHGKLFTLGLRQLEASFKGSLAAFSPTDRYVATVEQSGSLKENIIFADRDTGKQLKTLELHQLDNPRRSRPPSTDHRVLTFSDDGLHLFYGSNERAILINLNGLDLPQSPVWKLDLPEVVEANFGAPLSLPLSVTGKTQGKISIEPLECPKGVEISGEQLTWQPTLPQLGNHDLKLKITDEESSRTVWSQLRVELPNINCDQPVRKIAIGPKGQSIAIRTKEAILIVDLQPMRIVTRRQFKPGSLFALGDKSLFVWMKDGETLEEFEKSTLKPLRKLELLDSVRELHRLPGGKLLVLGPSAAELIDCATMSSEILSQDRSVKYCALPNGYFVVNSVVYSARGGYCCIYDEGNAIQLRTLPKYQQTARPILRPDQRWLEPAVSSDGLMLRASRMTQNGYLFSLNDTMKNHLATLNILPLGPVVPGKRTVINDLAVDNGALAIAIGNHLLAAKFSANDLQQKPAQRLHIQPPILGHANPRKKLNGIVKAMGGSGKYTFSVEGEGATIDAKSGRLTIDAPAIWKNAIARHRGRRKVQQLSTLKRPSTEWLSPIPGKQMKTTENPVRTPFQITVTTSAGEKAHLNIAVLLIGPRKDFK